MAGAAAIAVLCNAGAVRAQAIVHVDRASTERRAILDVVRVPVERYLGIKVVFVVRRLTTFGDWAFADLAPRTEAGGRIDYRRTRFAGDFDPDLDSDTVHALLRRTGPAWTLVEHAFLPTDVAWDWWRQQYRLPRTLFAD
jgi:hypothetical protein